MRPHNSIYRLIAPAKVWVLSHYATHDYASIGGLTMQAFLYGQRSTLSARPRVEACCPPDAHGVVPVLERLAALFDGDHPCIVEVRFECRRRAHDAGIIEPESNLCHRKLPVEIAPPACHQIPRLKPRPRPADSGDRHRQPTGRVWGHLLSAVESRSPPLSSVTPPRLPVSREKTPAPVTAPARALFHVKRSRGHDRHWSGPIPPPTPETRPTGLQTRLRGKHSGPRDRKKDLTPPGHLPIILNVRGRESRRN